MTTSEIVATLQSEFQTKEKTIAQLREALEAIKQEASAPYWVGSNTGTFRDIAISALKQA